MAQFKHSPVVLIGTTIHLGLTACLFLVYVIYIPGVKKYFDEYGLVLPQLTLSLIRLSNWLAEYWWTVAPIALLVAIVEYVVLSIAGQKTGFNVSWIVAVALVLALLLGATVYAMELPMQKVTEGLAR